MMLLSAVKARETTNEIVGKCLTEELEMISTRINQAITNGEYEAHIDKCISSTTTAKLMDFGYDVYHGSQYNEAYTVIKW